MKHLELQAHPAHPGSKCIDYRSECAGQVRYLPLSWSTSVIAALDFVGSDSILNQSIPYSTSRASRRDGSCGWTLEVPWRTLTSPGQSDPLPISQQQGIPGIYHDAGTARVASAWPRFDPELSIWKAYMPQRQRASSSGCCCRCWVPTLAFTDFPPSSPVRSADLSLPGGALSLLCV